MSDFGKTLIVAARKTYHCSACGGIIQRKERHVHFFGWWHDEFQNWRMHDECYNAMPTEDLVEGFEPESYTRPVGTSDTEEEARGV